jgi:hypothetical protein
MMAIESVIEVRGVFRVLKSDSVVRLVDIRNVDHGCLTTEHVQWRDACHNSRYFNFYVMK